MPQELCVDLVCGERFRAIAYLDDFAHVGLERDERVPRNKVIFTYSILEIKQCARMEGQHARLAGRGRPVDEHQGEGLAAVLVNKLVRQHDIARRVFGQLLSNTGQRGPLKATELTLRELLYGDVVELLDLLHDELGLVDLDDDGGVARAAAGEAELAQGILDLLRDRNEDRGGALWRCEWVSVHMFEHADHGGLR